MYPKRSVFALTKSGSVSAFLVFGAVVFRMLTVS